MIRSERPAPKLQKEKLKNGRIYVRSIPLCECLCSEFSLAQQKRTKEGLGPVLAGQRGSAHRTDMKMSGFIRQRRGTRGDDGSWTQFTFTATLEPQAVRSQVQSRARSRKTEAEKRSELTKPLFHSDVRSLGFLCRSGSFMESLNVCVR